jgi:septation ring formation regulator EzrA
MDQINQKFTAISEGWEDLCDELIDKSVEAERNVKIYKDKLKKILNKVKGWKNRIRIRLIIKIKS